jgi:hypothetical protein
MFINCKLFSHDNFVCNLISRGETFKNNLNYIQRPIQAILMRNNIIINQSAQLTKQQQQQQQQSIDIKQQQQQKQNSHTSLLINKRNSIDYTSPMSVYQQQPASMPAYQLPPHTPLQSQKSFNNDPIYNVAPHSVPTPSKSSSSNLNYLYQDDIGQSNNNNNNMNVSYENIPRSVQSNQAARIKANKILTRIKQQHLIQQQLKPMSKLALFVLHFPVPQTNQFQHERNQRCVVLYGFGVKRQEMLDNINLMNKNLFGLFTRKASIDLRESSLNNDENRRKKYFNTITTLNFSLSTAEQDQLNQISVQYLKMTYYDQYSIINKLNSQLIEIYKSLDVKNYLPKLQYLQFIFDLMESDLNIFNLILFAIKLLHVGPLIEQYLKKKFLKTNNSKTCFFEYLSYFYLNLIGVFRIHLVSLVLWKDLACEVFKCFLKLIKNVEKPSKCSSHEKCALMLLNEMYVGCVYIKTKFSSQFEVFASKIKSEKTFIAAPSQERSNQNSANFQMREDEQLRSMIMNNTSTEYIYIYIFFISNFFANLFYLNL